MTKYRKKPIEIEAILDPCECGFSCDSRRTMGRHYGYPPCCIDDYFARSARIDLGLPIDDDVRKLDGSGFVPCREHDRFPKGLLLEVVRSNRRCPIAFNPDGEA
jgi:hypothetical protein